MFILGLSYQHRIYRFKCDAKCIIDTFMCCSGNANKLKLHAEEQLYAKVFHLRSRRKFDEADKLQSLVDILCNGL